MVSTKLSKEARQVSIRNPPGFLPTSLAPQQPGCWVSRLPDSLPEGLLGSVGLPGSPAAIEPGLPDSLLDELPGPQAAQGKLKALQKDQNEMSCQCFPNKSQHFCFEGHLEMFMYFLFQFRTIFVVFSLSLSINQYVWNCLWNGYSSFWPALINTEICITSTLKMWG